MCVRWGPRLPHHPSGAEASQPGPEAPPSPPNPLPPLLLHPQLNAPPTAIPRGKKNPQVLLRGSPRPPRPLCREHTGPYPPLPGVPSRAPPRVLPCPVRSSRPPATPTGRSRTAGKRWRTGLLVSPAVSPPLPRVRARCYRVPPAANTAQEPATRARAASGPAPLEKARPVCK